jgi:hypothetical protein
MTSKLKKRYDSETTTSLKQRFEEETFSALKTRYVNEERVDEILGIPQKIDPERIKAFIAEIGKIENVLAQVDAKKIKTLRAATARARSNINSQKGLDSLTSFFGAFETLFRHLNDFIVAAKVDPAKTEEPLNTAMAPELIPTISQMISQQLNPGWLKRISGNSFLTGVEIKSIGTEMLELTMTEMKKMIPGAKAVVQTGEGEKAAKAPPQAEPSTTQTAQAGQAPAAQQKLNPSATEAFKALQTAGLSSLDSNQMKLLLNMISNSQAG